MKWLLLLSILNMCSASVEAAPELLDTARERLCDLVGEDQLARVAEDPSRYIGSPTLVDTSSWGEHVDSKQSAYLGNNGIELHLGVPEDVTYFSASEKGITPFRGEAPAPTLITSFGHDDNWGLSLAGPQTEQSRDIGWFRPGFSDALRSLKEFDSYEPMRQAIGAPEEVDAILDRLSHRLNAASDLELALHALSADPFGFAGEGTDPNQVEAFLWDWMGMCAAQSFHACQPFLLIEGADTHILLWNRVNRTESHPQFLVDIYDRESSEALFDGYLGFSERMLEEDIDYLRVIETLFEHETVVHAEAVETENLEE